MSVKQVIVMRTDLKMRKGKMISQGAHASMIFLSERIRYFGFQSNDGEFAYPDLHFTQEEKEWIQGSFVKICLQVDSEEDLDRIFNQAVDGGLTVHMVVDSGKTEFNGVPTKTCLAIGPNEAEKIDNVTGDLKLL